jgi:hypothetical protein
MVARRDVAAYDDRMGKVELRVEIDTELVAQARAAGIGLDEAAEVGRQFNISLRRGPEGRRYLKGLRSGNGSWKTPREYR